MNCLFGEIKEPTSRAVYSDDEDDSDEDANSKPSSFDLSYHLNKESSLMDGSTIKTIFVTFGQHKRSVPIDSELIGELKLTIQDQDDSTIGWLYKLSNSSICFKVNQRNSSVNTWLMGDILLKCFNKFGKFWPNTDVSLIIVSKQCNEGDKVEYLANQSVDYKNVKSILEKPMQTPKMITDCVESNIFEFATISEIPCILLRLPMYNSANLLNKVYPSSLWPDLLDQHQYLRATNLIYT